MGYEDGPCKESRPPPLVAADFLERIFNLCFIGSVGLDDHLTDSSLAVSCLNQPALAVVVLPAHTNKL